MALYVTTAAAAPLYPRFGTQPKDAEFREYTGAGGFDVLFVPPPMGYRSVIPQTSPIEPKLWALYAEVLALDSSAAGPGAHVLVPTPEGFEGRVVISPTGPLHRGIDDVRRVRAAVIAGLDRLRKAGPRVEKAKYVVVVAPAAPGFNAHPLAVVSAIGQAVWCANTNALSLCGPVIVGQPSAPPPTPLSDARTRLETAILYGQSAARALIGSDPHVGNPRACAAYAEAVIKRAAGLASSAGPDAANFPVEVSVIKDRDSIEKLVPMYAAVARASWHTDHQAPALVRIVVGPASASRRLYVVGKGVTYDTGGADVKTGGAMVGMHRDKGGAAGALGVAAAAVLLQRSDVRLEATLCMVRNSVGSDSYVPDEVVVAASGRRVRVVNTDAEGRMAMSDALYYAASAARSFAKGDDAAALTSPLAEAAEVVFKGGKDTPPAGDASKAAARVAHVYTFATLTGHVIRAYGVPYGAAMDNGPARAAALRSRRVMGANRLAVAGDMVGEPYEISTMRPEDYAFVTGEYMTEDIRQGNSAPSTMTARGHQFPAALMDEAAMVSCRGVPYTHLDIAGAALSHPAKPSGAPVASWVLATLVADGGDDAAQISRLEAATASGCARAAAEAFIAQHSPAITAADAAPETSAHD